MYRLDTDRRRQVVATLCEGMGVRPTSRVTGVAVNTIQSIIRSVGAACMRLHDEKVRNVPGGRIECDELWAFVYAREKHVPAPLKGKLGFGDVWLWTTLHATTKIIPAWFAGRRDTAAAYALMRDLRSRMAGRVELNTDGFQSYRAGIIEFYDHANPDDPGVDYAQVVKTFGTPNGKWNDRENRYEQPVVTSIEKKYVCGAPNVAAASTSYSERLNLGIRQHTKKLARLTNGHAKRLSMLRYTLAIQFAYYNFCKPHLTLGGQTPAQASGIERHRLNVADLCDLQIT